MYSINKRHRCIKEAVSLFLNTTQNLNYILNCHFVSLLFRKSTGEHTKHFIRNKLILFCNVSIVSKHDSNIELYSHNNY